MELVRRIREEVTWKQIAEDVRAGNAAKYAEAEMKVLLENGMSKTLVVVAVNHYKKNELVIAFKNYFGTRLPLNDVGITGWKNAMARQWLNHTFIDLLPDDLRKVIHKKTTKQNIKGKCYKSKDYLFLPSEMEMFGEWKYAKAQEGEKQFPYYKKQEHRRRLLGENGIPHIGLLSSPSTDFSSHFCHVNIAGDDCNHVSPYTAVAPVFVIR